MLLDALAKAPPQSLQDMRVFFDRSRSRLEQSLDKGNVTQEQRQTYLADFEEAVTQAQASFLNNALEKAHGAGVPAAGDDEDGKAPAAKAWAKTPMVWALIAFALVIGLAIGVVLGR